MKHMIITVLLMVLGAGGAVLYLRYSRTAHAEAVAHHEGYCSTHSIDEADCPWCDPSLIQKKGECAGHGVPEAFCSRCNPALIAGFKAENDWCAGHSVPESQCALCKGGGSACETGDAAACEAECDQ